MLGTDHSEELEDHIMETGPKVPMRRSSTRPLTPNRRYLEEEDDLKPSSSAPIAARAFEPITQRENGQQSDAHSSNSLNYRDVQELPEVIDEVEDGAQNIPQIRQSLSDRLAGLFYQNKASSLGVSIPDSFAAKLNIQLPKVETQPRSNHSIVVPTVPRNLPEQTARQQQPAMMNDSSLAAGKPLIAKPTKPIIVNYSDRIYDGNKYFIDSDEERAAIRGCQDAEEDQDYGAAYALYRLYKNQVKKKPTVPQFEPQQSPQVSNYPHERSIAAQHLPNNEDPYLSYAMKDNSIESPSTIGGQEETKGFDYKVELKHSDWEDPPKNRISLDKYRKATAEEVPLTQAESLANLEAIAKPQQRSPPRNNAAALRLQMERELQRQDDLFLATLELHGLQEDINGMFPNMLQEHLHSQARQQHVQQQPPRSSSARHDRESRRHSKEHHLQSSKEGSRHSSSGVASSKQEKARKSIDHVHENLHAAEIAMEQSEKLLDMYMKVEQQRQLERQETFNFNLQALHGGMESLQAMHYLESPPAALAGHPPVQRLDENLETIQYDDPVFDFEERRREPFARLSEDKLNRSVQVDSHLSQQPNVDGDPPSYESIATSPMKFPSSAAMSTTAPVTSTAPDSHYYTKHEAIQAQYMPIAIGEAEKVQRQKIHLIEQKHRERLAWLDQVISMNISTPMEIFQERRRFEELYHLELSKVFHDAANLVAVAEDKEIEQDQDKDYPLIPSEKPQSSESPAPLKQDACTQYEVDESEEEEKDLTEVNRRSISSEEDTVARSRLSHRSIQEEDSVQYDYEDTFVSKSDSRLAGQSRQAVVFDRDYKHHLYGDSHSGSERQDNDAVDYEDTFASTLSSKKHDVAASADTVEVEKESVDYEDTFEATTGTRGRGSMLASVSIPEDNNYEDTFVSRRDFSLAEEVADEVKYGADDESIEEEHELPEKEEETEGISERYEDENYDSAEDGIEEEVKQISDDEDKHSYQWSKQYENDDYSVEEATLKASASANRDYDEDFYEEDSIHSSKQHFEEDFEEEIPEEAEVTSSRHSSSIEEEKGFTSDDSHGDVEEKDEEDEEDHYAETFTSLPQSQSGPVKLFAGGEVSEAYEDSFASASKISQAVPDLSRLSPSIRTSIEEEPDEHEEEEYDDSFDSQSKGLEPARNLSKAELSGKEEEPSERYEDSFVSKSAGVIDSYENVPAISGRRDSPIAEHEDEDISEEIEEDVVEEFSQAAEDSFLALSKQPYEEEDTHHRQRQEEESGYEEDVYEDTFAKSFTQTASVEEKHVSDSQNEDEYYEDTFAKSSSQVALPEEKVIPAEDQTQEERAPEEKEEEEEEDYDESFEETMHSKSSLAMPPVKIEVDVKQKEESAEVTTHVSVASAEKDYKKEEEAKGEEESELIEEVSEEIEEELEERGEEGVEADEKVVDVSKFDDDDEEEDEDDGEGEYSEQGVHAVGGVEALETSLNATERSSALYEDSFLTTASQSENLVNVVAASVPVVEATTLSEKYDDSFSSSFPIESHELADSRLPAQTTIAVKARSDEEEEEEVEISEEIVDMEELEADQASTSFADDLNKRDALNKLDESEYSNHEEEYYEDTFAKSSSQIALSEEKIIPAEDQTQEERAPEEKEEEEEEEEEDYDESFEETMHSKSSLAMLPVKIEADLKQKEESTEVTTHVSVASAEKDYKKEEEAAKGEEESELIEEVSEEIEEELEERGEEGVEADEKVVDVSKFDDDDEEEDEDDGEEFNEPEQSADLLEGSSSMLFEDSSRTADNEMESSARVETTSQSLEERPQYALVSSTEKPVAGADEPTKPHSRLADLSDMPPLINKMPSVQQQPQQQQHRVHFAEEDERFSISAAESSFMESEGEEAPLQPKEDELEAEDEYDDEFDDFPDSVDASPTPLSLVVPSVTLVETTKAAEREEESYESEGFEEEVEEELPEELEEVLEDDDDDEPEEPLAPAQITALSPPTSPRDHLEDVANVEPESPGVLDNHDHGDSIDLEGFDPNQALNRVKIIQQASTSNVGQMHYDPVHQKWEGDDLSLTGFEDSEDHSQASLSSHTLPPPATDVAPSAETVVDHSSHKGIAEVTTTDSALELSGDDIELVHSEDVTPMKNSIYTEGRLSSLSYISQEEASVELHEGADLSEVTAKHVDELPVSPATSDHVQPPAHSAAPMALIDVSTDTVDGPFSFDEDSDVDIIDLKAKEAEVLPSMGAAKKPLILDDSLDDILNEVEDLIEEEIVEDEVEKSSEEQLRPAVDESSESYEDMETVNETPALPKDQDKVRLIEEAILRYLIENAILDCQEAENESPPVAISREQSHSISPSFDEKAAEEGSKVDHRVTPSPSPEVSVEPLQSEQSVYQFEEKEDDAKYGDFDSFEGEEDEAKHGEDSLTSPDSKSHDHEEETSLSMSLEEKSGDQQLIQGGEAEDDLSSEEGGPAILPITPPSLPTATETLDKLLGVIAEDDLQLRTALSQAEPQDSYGFHVKAERLVREASLHPSEQTMLFILSDRLEELCVAIHISHLANSHPNITIPDNYLGLDRCGQLAASILPLTSTKSVLAFLRYKLQQEIDQLIIEPTSLDKSTQLLQMQIQTDRSRRAIRCHLELECDLLYQRVHKAMTSEIEAVSREVADALFSREVDSALRQATAT
eukprot:scaffold967_cov173-Ochromonas_danica.AAC.38